MFYFLCCEHRNNAMFRSHAGNYDMHTQNLGNNIFRFFLISFQKKKFDAYSTTFLHFTNEAEINFLNLSIV